MLPTHVALVPYEDGLVELPDLLHVAAALQIQLTRDFTPVWGHPRWCRRSRRWTRFLLPTYPSSLSPKTVCHSVSMPFHTTMNGQAIGLVQESDDWSFAASHELLETICDPQGGARSVARRWPTAGGPLESGQMGQAVSAPGRSASICSRSATLPGQQYYMINGVKVSDFVTPRYYVAADRAEGVTHSPGRSRSRSTSSWRLYHVVHVDQEFSGLASKDDEVGA